MTFTPFYPSDANMARVGWNSGTLCIIDEPLPLIEEERFYPRFVSLIGNFYSCIYKKTPSLCRSEVRERVEGGVGKKEEWGVVKTYGDSDKINFKWPGIFKSRFQPSKMDWKMF